MKHGQFNPPSAVKRNIREKNVYGIDKSYAMLYNIYQYIGLDGMTPESVTKLIHITGSATPLYVQVAESLRSRIISGDLPPGSRLPSEAELAASLGINHLTLRKSLRILSEQKLISQRQGRGTFIAYPPARLLRIGLAGSHLSQKIPDLYILRIILAMNRQLNEINGGEIILIDCDGLNGGQILDKLNQNCCDGLIVINNSPGLAASLCNQAFDFIPMVFVNFRQQCIADAGRHEVRLAPGAIQTGLEYLMNLGHRRIAYVSADVAADSTLKQRNTEFLEHAPPEAIPLIAPNGAFWYNSARQSVFDLCRSVNPPTAILCPGVTFSYGAWLGAAEAGKRIPDDLAFVGFDANVNTNPYMTSLEQPFDEIAAKSLELIRDMRLAGKHLKQRVYEFSAELCEHGSCRQLK